MLVVDVAESDVGRVVLEEAQIGSTRDSGREVEVQVTLASFLLATQSTNELNVNMLARNDSYAGHTC